MTGADSDRETALSRPEIGTADATGVTGIPRIDVMSVATTDRVNGHAAGAASDATGVVAAMLAEAIGETGTGTETEVEIAAGQVMGVTGKAGMGTAGKTTAVASEGQTAGRIIGTTAGTAQAGVGTSSSRLPIH
jgi:hypothetical protein